MRNSSVAVVGADAVGKTSFVLALGAKEAVTNAAQQRQYLWPRPGRNGHKTTTVRILRSREEAPDGDDGVFVLLFDLTRRDSLAAVIAQWAHLADVTGRKLLLVGTHVDCNSKREILSSEVREISGEFHGYEEVCCRPGDEGMLRVQQRLTQWTTGGSAVMASDLPLARASICGGFPRPVVTMMMPNVWLYDPTEEVSSSLAATGVGGDVKLRTISKAIYDIRGAVAEKSKALTKYRDRQMSHWLTRSRYFGPTESSRHKRWQEEQKKRQLAQGHVHHHVSNMRSVPDERGRSVSHPDKFAPPSRKPTARRVTGHLSSSSSSENEESPGTPLERKSFMQPTELTKQRQRQLEAGNAQEQKKRLATKRALRKQRRAASNDLDTIYALSSAPGKAGVAVIRISGDQADSCLQQLSKSTALPKPRVAAMRKLYHPKRKEHLDDALVLRFPHPKSFTGEDIVELHTHGSVAVVSGVLEALSHVPHCRAAEAGEFTERAFDNNKIDLVQVEGLADLLSAETEAQRGQALRQLSGDIGEIYEGWRDSLVKCLAYTEAMIDFGDDEDDVTDASYEAAVDRVRALADSIRGHLADGRRGEILRSGVQVAILGPPNAGKSSLLNILARRPAAIVSSIAGTTRDVVQVPLNIAGYPVIVSDTAGLRETEDIVEKEGVLRAQQCASDADICVVMMDIQTAGQLHSGEYQSYLRDGAFAVLNKSDQVDESHIASVLETFDSKQRDQLLIVSCAEGDNIDVFVDKLASAVKDKLAVSAGGSTNGALITRERHRQNLVECLSCLDRFLADPYQSEIAAEDLRRAVMAIGRILGRIDVEDVLDVLFADFCIGK
ncbi:hypothetical protein JG688_00001719 [Phytophthora aleatoria]|uniref:TrmE-type G domain-containing protein n=1 Tax=Phytophthora aleatoria TaxID=2496075 RepID=A0A8J5MD54_9STRA|nr:hypothetical protein JG688_00001719 [Phytophthora aleatoria]